MAARGGVVRFADGGMVRKYAEGGDTDNETTEETTQADSATDDSPTESNIPKVDLGELETERLEGTVPDAAKVTAEGIKQTGEQDIAPGTGQVTGDVSVSDTATGTVSTADDVTAIDPSRANRGNHGALGGPSQESSNKPSQTSEAVSKSVKQPVANTPAVGIDSSVTPRLVQWRLAFSETSPERLLFGMPRAAFIEMQRQALDSGQAQGLIRPWRNLHNDLIDAFITKGIFGLLSLVVFVVLTMRFFYCRLKSENEQIQSFASLGLLVLAMVALFSISDVQLDKGAVTHTLTFLLLTLTALILQHENELPAHRL